MCKTSKRGSSKPDNNNSKCVKWPCSQNKVVFCLPLFSFVSQPFKVILATWPECPLPNILLYITINSKRGKKTIYQLKIFLTSTTLSSLFAKLVLFEMITMFSNFITLVADKNIPFGKPHFLFGDKRRLGIPAAGVARFPIYRSV